MLEIGSIVTEIMIFQDDELEEPLRKLKMGKLHCVCCMYMYYYCTYTTSIVRMHAHTRMYSVSKSDSSNLLTAVEESMPAQIAEYEEAKRTESVSSATDRVSVHVQ